MFLRGYFRQSVQLVGRKSVDVKYRASLAGKDGLSSEWLRWCRGWQTFKLHNPAYGEPRAGGNKQRFGPNRTLDVFEIGATGEKSLKKLKLKEVLDRFGVHARDFSRLGLRYAGSQKGNDPKLVILPRGSVIVASLGVFKMLLYSDSLLLFDAKRPVVIQASDDLADLIKLNAMTEDPYYGNNLRWTAFRSRGGLPFELAVLEAALQEYCDSIQRRYHIFSAMVRKSLRDITAHSASSRADLYKLVPIDVSLRSFDIDMKQAKEAICCLLESDEDMAQLLLTERRLLKDLPVPSDRHGSVELMLENYLGQLTVIHNELSQLMEEVLSTQKLVAMNIDVSRNSLILLEVQLVTASLGVSICAAIFSLYGMNLISGLEELSGAFSTVLGTAIAISGFMYYKFYQHTHNIFIGKRNVDYDEAQQLQSVTKVLQDVGSLESVIRANITLDLDKSSIKDIQSLCTDKLRRQLEEETGRSFNEEQVMYIIQMLDHSRDGLLDESDWAENEMFFSSEINRTRKQ